LGCEKPDHLLIIKIILNSVYEYKNIMSTSPYLVDRLDVKSVGSYTYSIEKLE